MGVHIQWLKEKDGEIGVFRCGEDFDEFGDPWEMVSVIQRTKDGGVHMIGAQSNMRSTQIFKYLREIDDLMRQEGVSYIVWEKLRPDGTMKNIRIDIKEN